MSRGGWGTKIHFLCTGNGTVLAIDLSAGQAHDSPFLLPLLEGELSADGKLPPSAVCGDKAYSAGYIRDRLNELGIQDMIPTKKNEASRDSFDREIYRDRHFIENQIGWVKEYRCVATRYDKLATHFRGTIMVACIDRLLRGITKIQSESILFNSIAF